MKLASDSIPFGLCVCVKKMKRMRNETKCPKTRVVAETLGHGTAVLRRRGPTCRYDGTPGQAEVCAAHS